LSFAFLQLETHKGQLAVPAAADVQVQLQPVAPLQQQVPGVAIFTVLFLQLIKGRHQHPRCLLDILGAHFFALPARQNPSQLLDKLHSSSQSLHSPV
jgi:hypothetical protein